MDLKKFTDTEIEIYKKANKKTVDDFKTKLKAIFKKYGYTTTS